HLEAPSRALLGDHGGARRGALPEDAAEHQHRGLDGASLRPRHARRAIPYRLEQSDRRDRAARRDQLLLRPESSEEDDRPAASGIEMTSERGRARRGEESEA